MMVDLFEARYNDFRSKPRLPYAPEEERYMVPLSCCSEDGEVQPAICLVRRRDGVLQRCYADCIYDFPERLRSDETINVKSNTTVYISTQNRRIPARNLATSAGWVQLELKYDPVIVVKEHLKLRNEPNTPTSRKHTQVYRGETVCVALEMLHATKMEESDQRQFVLHVDRPAAFDLPMRVGLTPGEMGTHSLVSHNTNRCTDLAVVQLTLNTIAHVLKAHISPLPSTYEIWKGNQAGLGPRLRKRYQIRVTFREASETAWSNHGDHRDST